MTGECDVLTDDESDELRHVLPHHKEMPALAQEHPAVTQEE
jgi:hypothetical protein